MFRSIWLVCLFPWLAAIAQPAGAQDKPALREALALEEAIQDAIAAAEPSVACILVSHSNQRPNLADPGYVPELFGSGVVIDQQGLILTNYHVVRDEPTQIYVRLLGGKGSYARIHAADPRSDLAVLQLRDKLDLKPIKLGDAGKVRKGQFVICLSNPYAAGSRDGSPSASQGIISNIRRRAPGNPKQEKEEAEVPRGNQKKPLQRYSTLFQTDARLNLGCSGGALINLRGEMIGLTTSLAALSGGETAGGFAVP
ncbi:MAG TPA: trypsin-like peptidase domain-containing protein, partial [Gemmataceae bacterium]|nr:trypsin-like peptidase domain-containing protein [Gemmataceae bacterium]